MKTIRTVLVAGAAVVALAGLAGQAFAGSPETHVMTVQLPGGGIEQVRYTGNVAPEVIVDPVGPSWAAWAPIGWYAPFASFERISAEMDRAMAGMLREAAALSAQPFGANSGVTEASMENLPAGTESYSFVSTASGNGVCGYSTEVTSEGPGHKPHVVSKSFGNCGAQGTAAPTELPVAPSPDRTPDNVQIRANTGARPFPGLVHEVSCH